MKYLISSYFLFIFLIPPVLAYNCPFSRINDPFPGSCALYTDQNNDGLCDNSQDISETNIAPINYYLWQIIGLFIIFQLIGISLIEYNKLNKMLWRKMNNYVLLVSFLVVLVTGLLLLANLSDLIYSNNLRTINWLHIESGLIMILFSLEHILRHWRCFKF